MSGPVSVWGSGLRLPGSPRPPRASTAPLAPSRAPERPRDPRHGGHTEPEQDPRGSVLRLVAAQGDDEEEAAADVDGDVHPREDQAPLAERVGQRDRHHEGAEHGGEDQQLDRRPLRVVQVGYPHRVGPDPPDREQQYQQLEGATPGEALDQAWRELGDRQDQPQIEEQFQERCPLWLPGPPQQLTCPTPHLPPIL